MREGETQTMEVLPNVCFISIYSFWRHLKEREREKGGGVVSGLMESQLWTDHGRGSFT